MGFVTSQFFILRPLDGGDSLVLCYAACKRLLNRVTDIHKHLSITVELFPALPEVCGKGTMPRHEDIGSKPCGRVHRLEPVKAVAIVHE